MSATVPAGIDQMPTREQTCERYRDNALLVLAQQTDIGLASER